MKRLKISKESLLSIGFEYNEVNGDNFYRYKIEDLTEGVSVRIYDHLEEVYIYDFTDFVRLPRTFEFIDEITTLLTGLTGKNNFHS